VENAQVAGGFRYHPPPPPPPPPPPEPPPPEKPEDDDFGAGMALAKDDCAADTAEETERLKSPPCQPRLPCQAGV
jgi:hypothetical protein